MKNFKDFFRAFLLILWFLWQTVFKYVVIILIFWIVSFAAGFFTGNMKITEIACCLIGLVISLILIIPCFGRLVSDVFIIIKGFKYVGVCNGMARPYKSSGFLSVTWTDNNNHEHTHTFKATDNKNKYPHDVNVYSYENIMNLTNLGWRTVVKDVCYVLLFMPFFVITVFMNFFVIRDIIKNGFV